MIAVQEFNLMNPGGGGANEKLKGDLVRDNQSAPPSSGTLPLKNCHTNVIGAIVKRKGYTLYSGRLSLSGSPTTNMEEITGMVQYKKFNGNEYEVVCASSGGSVGIFDISTPASPTEIQGAISITDDTKFSFAIVNDTLLLSTEDRDGLFKWTGSGNVTEITGSPAPPAGKYVLEFENYAFTANTSTNPERVYFSALADPESWLATDFIRLNGECVGIGKAGNEMFAFTRFGITLIRFTGDAVSPFSAEQLETRVGCASHHSIINVEGVLYWMAGDGHVYRMRGLQPERVTEIIPVTVGRLNKGVLSKVHAVNHNELRQVWFCGSLDAATNNDFIIAIDYLNEEIFFYDGFSINYIANFTDSSGVIKTYFGDRTGRIYLTNNGNLDTPEEVDTAIQMYRYTKQFHLGAPSKKKRIRKLTGTVNNQGSAVTTISIEGDFGAVAGETVSIDHDAGDTTIGEFIIGTDALGGIEDNEDTTDVCTVAKHIQLKIENTQESIPVEVRDISMSYQTLPRLLK